jgi:hypothetical protein
MKDRKALARYWLNIEVQDRDLVVSVPSSVNLETVTGRSARRGQE